MLVLLTQSAAAQVDRASAIVEMRGIYSSLRTLLPLSVDDAAFRDPQQHEAIRTALADVAERAQHVGKHVAGDDRRVRFLAEALSRDAQEARARFVQGRHDSARFLVRRLTDYCIACHTQLPSGHDSPLARDFVSDGALAKLPLDERASIQVATRRFDDALASWETLFDSAHVRPAELLAPLTDYLRVSIRVKKDLERPRRTLRRLAARPDLWSNLRGDVEDWLAALDRHVARPERAPSLDSARVLLAEARDVLRYPTDRRGLVQRLIASSELHRFLDEHAGAAGRDIAEAHYLLGVIDGHASFDRLVSESEFHLETAIRLAPTDPIGRRAFDLLEEQAILGWTGSSGSHMPQDIRERLDLLRGLVEQAPARSQAAD